MRPILTISEDEINEQLLRVIKLLFTTNVDQIIIQREKTSPLRISMPPKRLTISWRLLNKRDILQNFLLIWKRV